MREGLIVLLEGPRAAEVAGILAVRLDDLGRQASWAASAEGGWRSLVENGGIVITSDAALESEGVPRLCCPLSPHDTPDFAAEKVLDQLAEAGAVNLENADYSPEEEERIRKRLADLGYIE